MSASSVASLAGFVTPAAVVARRRSAVRAAVAPAKISVRLNARGRVEPTRASPVVHASSRDACDARRARVHSKAGNDDESGNVAIDPGSPGRFAWLGSFAKVAALAAVACAVTALLFPDTAMAAAKKAALVASTDPLWKRAISFILHLDKHLVGIFANYGVAAYGMLFAIVFCETGLVVTPFLPGDSLLFACGALGAQGIMNAPLVTGLLFLAAVMGDTVNYGVGNFIGGKVIQKYPKIFKKAYIDKTKGFYEKYGGKTVVLARFFPIIRTFAPFVAGVANMNYTKFFFFNVVGAAVWVGLFMFLGYFFGTIPAVQENFAATIVAIILLSCLPVVYEIIQAKKEAAAEKAAAGGGSGSAPA